MKNRRSFLLQSLLGGMMISQSRFRASAQELPSSGSNHPAHASIDVSMKEFLQIHKIPGAAVAISRGGKLLYAKGFGVQQVGSNEEVKANSLFRIASVSKPITGIAIVKLIQDRSLKLQDTVWSLLSLREPSDLRWKEITIEQLLKHTAGFDPDKSFDPMFYFREIAQAKNLSFPISHQDLIDFMLDQPLDHTPGSQYAYSNFGYCLLGRVIEKVSGQSYEEHVRSAIWKPISVEDAHIGRSLAVERLKNEVTYHDISDRRGTPVVATSETELPYPYGVWDIAAMDAHGGWVCSAPQLVRLAGECDFSGKSNLLSPAAIKRMFLFERESGSSDPISYGLGWQLRNLGNNKINAWHNGLLDGTASLLVKRCDGFNWCGLFNTHLTTNGTYIIELFDPLMHEIVDRVKRWPSVDLFKDYLS
jgi:CubicO group peptidase (beta-lactamase class C family)